MSDIFRKRQAQNKGELTYTLYRHRDWRGAVTMVTDGKLNLVQHTGYYPYGEPWREPLGQPYLFEGKERMRDFGLNEYDFTARRLYSPLCIWTGPDKLALQYSPTNPFVYCAGNPVKYTDSSGMKIEGVTEDDALKFQSDLSEIFKAEKFTDFRNLLKLDGKKFCKIDETAMNSALSSDDLSEDDKALMNIVANTINSKSRHTIEYYDEVATSERSIKILTPVLEMFDINIEATLNIYKGLPGIVIENRGGEGLTGKLGRGSHSIVDNNISNRAVISAHEVLGHGRSLSLGRTTEQQHVDAIQLENLVHRVIGSPIVRDGHDHGPKTIITNASEIPTQLINQK